MASYSIRWRSSTRKEMRQLPVAEVPRIVAAVERLGDEPLPHGSQKLAGSDRIRVGEYRVIYEVSPDAQVVEVQRVRHRRDAYRP